MGHRSTHYFLWFIFFGLVFGIVRFAPGASQHALDAEALWLTITGLLGMIVTAKWLNEGKFARPYDFVVGLILTIVGLIGIAQAFQPALLAGVNAAGSVISSTSILGLLTTMPYALIHVVLGLTSINHGINREK